MSESTVPWSDSHSAYWAASRKSGDVGGSPNANYLAKVEAGVRMERVSTRGRRAVSTSATIHTAQVTFELLGQYVDLDWRMPIPGCLTWFPDRPWEIRVTFHAPSGDVAWSVGRELLRDGLAGDSPGIGDVRVWKSPQRTQRPWLRVHLISRAGAALFRVPAREVREFLAGTVRGIPLGTEFDAIDVDAEAAGSAR